MKSLFLVLVIVPVIWARPAQDATIVRSENVNQPDGGYRFLYETSDGIKRDEVGEVINQGTEQETVVMRGSFSYVGPDGVTYTVNYVADENGFQPQGDHIPQGATGSVNPPPSKIALFSAGAFGALVG